MCLWRTGPSQGSLLARRSDFCCAALAATQHRVHSATQLQTNCGVAYNRLRLSFSVFSTVARLRLVSHCSTTRVVQRMMMTVTPQQQLRGRHRRMLPTARKTPMTATRQPRQPPQAVSQFKSLTTNETSWGSGWTRRCSTSSSVCAQTFSTCYVPRRDYYVYEEARLYDYACLHGWNPMQSNLWCRLLVDSPPLDVVVVAVCDARDPPTSPSTGTSTSCKRL